jgi:dihydrofolate reductase
VARLIYMTIASLDGYIEDESGGFDWAMPDDEVHAFVNDLARSPGTHLYGRGMYETMAVWEEFGKDPTDPKVFRDFGEIWRAADKVVYSTTLEEVWTERTRLEREFDPLDVAQLKAAADRDLTVSGPGLAAEAFTAGLVDELQLFLHPVIVGGGKPALPDGVRLDLELADERRFASGVAYLRYVSSDSGSE